MWSLGVAQSLCLQAETVSVWSLGVAQSRCLQAETVSVWSLGVAQSLCLQAKTVSIWSSRAARSGHHIFSEIKSGSRRDSFSFISDIIIVGHLNV